MNKFENVHVISMRERFKTKGIYIGQTFRKEFEHILEQHPKGVIILDFEGIDFFCISVFVELLYKMKELLSRVAVININKELQFCYFAALRRLYENAKEPPKKLGKRLDNALLENIIEDIETHIEMKCHIHLNQQQKRIMLRHLRELLRRRLQG